MNKYIIPICDIPNSKVYNKIILATSYQACEDKLMTYFNSDANTYEEFIAELDNQDILIGEIKDIEEL